MLEEARAKLILLGLGVGELRGKLREDLLGELRLVELGLRHALDHGDVAKDAYAALGNRGLDRRILVALFGTLEFVAVAINQGLVATKFEVVFSALVVGLFALSLFFQFFVSRGFVEVFVASHAFILGVDLRAADTRFGSAVFGRRGVPLAAEAVKGEG
jgi:hypothetical protein